MQTQTRSDGPGHRDLYLLVAGVVAGVLLGPGVFGRLAPEAYDEVFPPSIQTVGLQLVELEKKLAANRELLRQIGATDAAISDLEAQRPEKRTELEARFDRASRSAGRTTSLLVALVVTMILEAAIGAHRVRRRLTQARYALLAIWVALILAQPAVLSGISLPFVAMLTLIVLIAAVVPFRT